MQEYINKIIDNEIKENVQFVYDSLPDYFHHVPASSSGKYHPSFSLGDGGLKRHTKFACDIAIDMFKITDFESIEKDIILASLILHDGLKHGLEDHGYTVSEHDDIMSNYLKKLWKNKKLNYNLKLIICCIRSHMGQWATTKNPKTKLEKFVHWCDYLASRKFVDNYYGASKKD